MLGIAFRIEYQVGEGHTLILTNGEKLIIHDGFPALQPFNLVAPGFHLSENWDLSAFDPFAASFFMLTRLEESGLDARDVHGRFTAERSQGVQQKCLHRPVVNEWADLIWNALVRIGWRAERKQRKFQMSISCDVDHPRLWWSTTDRLKTLAAAVFKRGDLGEAGYWLRNHIFQKKDPYDIFDEWLDLFEKSNVVAQFNFMGVRPRTSDCWYPLQHPFVMDLMAKIAVRGHKIGFHPSYEAYDDPLVFDRELASLRAVSPIEITSGRQHYLRFKVPETWQVWEAAGLQEDSTLGYPEVEGFRCGICHDFPVFDIEQRKMLHLREKPLIAMDVTLAQYRHYTPAQAVEHLTRLRLEVEKHDGDFTLLWHNSSWNSPFWEAWKAVFLSVVLG